jgi:transglutaminase/protease-like cytokinesis protein 3
LFYQCDEFYFITDPEDHIYQHFPDDPKWQLLECPITLTEFINLPIVKSPFFALLEMGF